VDSAVKPALQRACAALEAGLCAALSPLLQSDSFDGTIPSDRAAALARALGGNADRLVVALLPLARVYSRAPISGFHVGSVCRGKSGNLYLGANLELAGQGLGTAVHAEQSAIVNAHRHGERGVTALASSAPPCGLCRQFLAELGANAPRILLADGSATALSDLLPRSFGPADLGVLRGPFDGESHPLAVDPRAEPLVAAAAEAAAASWAPYTHAWSGVALETDAGAIFAGGYLENAAFNPSVGPLQAALVSLVLNGRSTSAIRRVALVEVAPAPISQAPAAEAVLSTLAPRAKLTVVRLAPRG
jgi:cytidine deaminase